VNREQIEKSRAAFGSEVVDMLVRVHEDALWILENIGVGCKQPDILRTFKEQEEKGLAYVFEDRIFVTNELVNLCLETVPKVDEFFVPMNSFFIGGTAPYVYDDEAGEGGVFPEPEHAARIAQIAEANDIVAGMGRGIKLKDEVEQMNIMVENCTKPMYLAVTSDESLKRALEIYEKKKDLMIVFCLTRSPLEVNENFSEHFYKVARAGLPVFDSAMPMAGISAPYCYNGVLAMTHAEVLFGLCITQLVNPGVTFIHAGFPTIADPSIEYNPNYGLLSHFLLNLMMTHLSLMLDIPACQSAGTTHEEHLTEKAYQDCSNGQAMCRKYGFHMIRHPFSFLRYLIDFSFEKLEKGMRIAENISPDEAPEVVMPEYDERGMESIRNIGLGMYMEDPLTTANLGKVFVQ
jgi:trimethylamine:corrinoid methyltransferase-like protein